MSSSEERVIAESLEALESGRSIEKILAEHPDQVETLRPILATAATLSSLKIAHSIGAQSNSLDLFLGTASARKAAGAGRKRSFWLFGRRLAVSLSVMLLLLVIITFPLTLAAQSAIPGDALYNAKVTIEDIRLSLVGEGLGRDRLTGEFNQNRIAEIEELMASGRSASGIEFTGIIEAIDGETWVISGLPLMVSDSLASSGQIKIGQDVIVVVNVLDGEVEATRIVKPSSLDNSPEPGPIITKEPEDDVEPDPEASPTLKATPTVEATPTLEATPAATAVLSETPEPTIAPTPVHDESVGPEATSTSESDDHDNSGEDNESDDIDDDNDDESDDSSGRGDDDSANDGVDDDGEGSGSGSDDDDGDDDDGGSDDDNERSGSGSDDSDDSSDSDDDNSGSSHEEDEEDEEDEKGDSGGGS